MFSRISLVIIFAVQVLASTRVFAQDSATSVPTSGAVAPSTIETAAPETNAMSTPTSASSDNPLAPTPELTAGTVSSVSAPLPGLDLTTPPVKFKGNLDVLEIGREYDDKYMQSAGSLTVVTPHFDAIYTSWMSFDLELSGIFVAGNTKNLYTDEGKGTNIVILDEAAVNFKPIKELDIRAGALLTKINPILSIMSENAFVGMSQKYTFTSLSQNVKLSFGGEEAIPSAGTVTPGLIDGASDAYFLTGTLAADINFTGMSSRLKIATTAFEFGNLSSNVASDCRFIGNSPESFDGIGDSSRFTIGFAGYESALSFKTDWTNTFSSEFVGSTIINQKAPGDRNNGIQTFVNVKKKFEKFNLVPSLGYFDMAADVTPATYTIFPNRYHNRKGYTVELDVQLDKQKIVFFGSYTRANVLQDSIYLADRNMFNLGLEAKYDFL